MSQKAETAAGTAVTRRYEHGTRSAQQHVPKDLRRRSGVSDPQRPGNAVWPVGGEPRDPCLPPALRGVEEPSSAAHQGPGRHLTPTKRNRTRTAGGAYGCSAGIGPRKAGPEAWCWPSVRPYAQCARSTRPGEEGGLQERSIGARGIACDEDVVAVSHDPTPDLRSAGPRDAKCTPAFWDHSGRRVAVSRPDEEAVVDHVARGMCASFPLQPKAFQEQR